MDKIRELTVKIEQCFLDFTGTYDRQPKGTKSKRLVALGKKYGIKFVTKDSLRCADIRYDAPTRAQLLASVPKLEESFSIYSKEMIKRSGIEQIILCRNLNCIRFNKKPQDIAGLAMSGFHVVDTLFLDARYFIRDSWHGNRLFHHELFHAIDYRDTWFGHVDAEWRHLQGSNFQYGIELLAEYIATTRIANINDLMIEEYDIQGVEARPCREPGFVSDYSRISYVEDKAEIFASLITDYKGTTSRARKDLPLKNKVKHMKKLLRKFCPEFNAKFWEKRRDNPIL